MTALAAKFRDGRLGEQLVADGMITREQLAEALERQRQTGAFIGEAIVALGFVKSSTMGHYLQGVTGFPYVDITECPVDEQLARSIPEHLARRKVLLPFAEQDDAIHVAMADPLDLSAVDDLVTRLGRRIVPFLAFQDEIIQVINRLYDMRQAALSVLDEIEDASSPENDLSVDELVGLSEGAPIVRLVNSIVHTAISAGASDIHIEPQEKQVRVRLRQDGLLYDQMTFPRNHLAAVVSRIKVMSHLDISERRRPQDGRFVCKHENGREYDLRVSVLPLIFGEKVVMRVLEKTSSLGDADMLGFFPEQRELFERFVRRPHGILLVTGPTGSGKSTSLYAALNLINDSTRNISTVEDPVEFHLQGVNQVQVHSQIGMTFAASLRALVRQDPDVIMIGEIRDRETAEIAVQAALTGHLVLTTLHTNDAPGALIRLQNMGVEPFLIGSAVIGVIGQRLVRTVCTQCKEIEPADPVIAQAFGMTIPEGAQFIMAHGRGCPRCNGTGMKGRTGVYEFMPMSDTLRQMIVQNASAPQLREQAISEGMMTMRECALRKMLTGQTTPDEVTRVLFSEDF
jgi:type IV pilus assembly protein PilB